MKRTISLILCAVLMLAALAGCAEKVPASSGTRSPAASAQTAKPAEEQSAKGLDQPDKAVAVPVNGFAQALYHDGGVYYINSNSDLCRLEDGETTGMVLAMLDDFGGYFSQIYAITENGYAYLSGGRHTSDSRRSVAVDLYTGAETVLTYPGASGEALPLAIEFIWNEWLYYSKNFEVDCTLYRRPLGGGYADEEPVSTFDETCGTFYLCGDELFFVKNNKVCRADVSSPGAAEELFYWYGEYGPHIYADDAYVFCSEYFGRTERNLQIYSRADGSMTRCRLGSGWEDDFYSAFYYNSADRRIYGYEGGRMIYLTLESLESGTYYVPDGAWSQASIDYVEGITLVGDWFYCMFYYDNVEGMNYRISLDGTQGLGLIAVSPDDSAFDARTDLDMEEAWEAGLVKPEDVQAAYDATLPEARTGIMGGWIDESAGLVFDFYSEHGVMVYATEDNDSWADDGRAFLGKLYGIGSDVGYDRALDYIAYNLEYSFESGYLSIYRTYGSGEIFSYVVQVQDDASLTGETASGDSFTLRRLTDGELKSAKDGFFDKLEELLG